MATGFLNQLPGGIAVIQRKADKDWGDTDMNSPRKGCGHTTEGDSLPSYGVGQRDAPTFTIGKKKVWQHRALGKGCGTLQNDAGGGETNTLVHIQFELIGFSTEHSWLPTEAFQRDALSAIKELAHDELGVPRGHVWPDKQETGVVLATEKYERRHKKFPHEPGWYGHVEIPENDHWDWGSLKWDDLDGGVSQLVEALAFVERFKKQNGTWSTREISPFFSGKGALRNWAVVPDGANADNEDDLRKSFFDALCENRVWVAKRMVAPELVKS
jgi:hypothetical protein